MEVAPPPELHLHPTPSDNESDNNNNNFDFVKASDEEMKRFKERVPGWREDGRGGGGRSDPGDCWLHYGRDGNIHTNSAGYSYRKHRGRTMGAHIFSFEQHIGRSVLPGHHVAHLCPGHKNCKPKERCLHRVCVRPSHLAEQLPKENDAAENRRKPAARVVAATGGEQPAAIATPSTTMLEEVEKIAGMKEPHFLKGSTKWSVAVGRVERTSRLSEEEMRAKYARWRANADERRAKRRKEEEEAAEEKKHQDDYATQVRALPRVAAAAPPPQPQEEEENVVLWARVNPRKKKEEEEEEEAVE